MFAISNINLTLPLKIELPCCLALMGNTYVTNYGNFAYFVSYIPSQGSCSIGNSQNGSTSLILPDISTLTSCQPSVIKSTHSDSSSIDGDIQEV